MKKDKCNTVVSIGKSLNGDPSVFTGDLKKPLPEKLRLKKYNTIKRINTRK